MRRRAMWWSSTAVAALLLTGLGGLLLVRHGPLPGSWAYGALVLAASGAVASSLLCVARAHGAAARGQD